MPYSLQTKVIRMNKLLNSYLLTDDRTALEQYAISVCIFFIIATSVFTGTLQLLIGMYCLK